MATPINPLPNLTQYNFDIGDIEEVVTKQNGVNAVLEQLGPQINTTVASINQDVTDVNNAAANLNVAEIVHAPGSGLNNEAGDAYSRDVIGDAAAPLMAKGYLGLGAPTAYFLSGDGVLDSLDDISSLLTGFHSTDSNTIGNPDNRTATSIINLNDGIRNILLQITTDGDFRIKSDDVSSWVNFFNSANAVGSNSHNGTSPSGSIFQIGSNSDGTYIKYFDGTLICIRKDYNLGDPTFSGDGTWGNLYETSPVDWTYPWPFISSGPSFFDGRLNNASLSGKSGPQRRGIVTVFNINSPTTAPSVRWCTLHNNQNTADVYIDLFAIGRWY
ncbi:hypothetical protein [Vreelandella titanicae]|uniref:hypothetical protein n=1 Tax=Vreelandella titanicae TaxID=664683 RepID=UPI00381193E2